MLLTKKDKQKLQKAQKSIKSNKVDCTVTFIPHEQKSAYEEYIEKGGSLLTQTAIENYKKIALPARLRHKKEESGHEKNCEICNKHFVSDESVCVECQRDITGEPISSYTDQCLDYWKSTKDWGYPV